MKWLRRKVEAQYAIVPDRGRDLNKRENQSLVEVLTIFSLLEIEVIFMKMFSFSRLGSKYIKIAIVHPGCVRTVKFLMLDATLNMTCSNAVLYMLFV
jgi:hypothetical protein